MKKVVVLLALAAFAGAALAFDRSHQAWSELLRKHVVLMDGGLASRLNYAGIAQERAALRGYLETLSRVSEGEFAAWSKPEQMAFLINAYNAHAVEKILTRYPNLKSIWDFGKFFGNPFRDEFFSLLGSKMSLDGIEHGILRKRYGEPRVHYAVNCASIGCPMLRDGRLEVSRIFDWFKEDFEPRDKYFSRYAGILGVPPGASPPLVFLDYDWSLNDSRSSSPR